MAQAQSTSLLVVLAGVVFLIWGLVITLIGVGLTAGGQAIRDYLVNHGYTVDFGGAITVIGIVVLVVGILHLIVAVFSWAHRAFARYTGIAIAAIFVLFGILALASSSNSDSVSGTRSSVGGDLVFLLVPYGFCLIALIVGGRHFRRA